MALNPYNPISTIDPTTYDWSCRVRVQSFWKGLNRESQEFWGLNMLLIDDSNSRIHAFANSKYCDDLLKEIKEGQIYTISNFKVKDYLGDEKFRAVRNKRHIFFTPHTRFKECSGLGLQIENYAFDLFHFDEIEKLADDNRFLIDMVGKVKNIQELIKTKKNEEDKILFKFELSNGSSNLHVTLFDSFGEQLEKEFAQLDIQNLYVIICCARVGRYEGVPHLSNYPATRVFINPKHHSVDDLKKRCSEMKPQTDIVDVPMGQAEVDLPRKLMTVKEIKGIKAETGEAIVLCEVTVKRITDKSAWYFRKCTGCDLELEHDNGKFRCSRPNGCDDTGSIAIIFPDQAITRILDKTVIDLHADCADETEEEKFPEILNSLLKRKYTVNLGINEDNIKKGSTVYEAIDILQDQEKGDSFDPNKTPVAEIQDVSMVTVSETDATTHLTPNTGDSTTMKTRGRKITEALDFNPTDPSALQPLKSVKLENIPK
ncbi:uncharacterized protein LOC108192535 [Daucus carota subsp. sativus]|uniref:uncharacterized protein LOC108192535 n=1 Tax=Daucus carota subsp. sativus TaxID=79200 RepID=UPI0007EF8774|nr:PREDICTED: uncharacterized protein LOC108192535 [Daucus carota subsp. sativus]